jgi:hypothetical protein
MQFCEILFRQDDHVIIFIILLCLLDLISILFNFLCRWLTFSRCLHLNQHFISVAREHRLELGCEFFVLLEELG